MEDKLMLIIVGIFNTFFQQRYFINMLVYNHPGFYKLIIDSVVLFSKFA